MLSWQSSSSLIGQCSSKYVRWEGSLRLGGSVTVLTRSWHVSLQLPTCSRAIGPAPSLLRPLLPAKGLEERARPAARTPALTSCTDLGRSGCLLPPCSRPPPAPFPVPIHHGRRAVGKEAQRMDQKYVYATPRRWYTSYGSVFTSQISPVITNSEVLLQLSNVCFFYR